MENPLKFQVLIARRCYIRREAYFAILLDRKTSNVVMVASRFGGMDIESVAAENPHAIIKVFLFVFLKSLV